MKLVEYAESVGIQLLPWQREYAEAVERGETPVMVISKRAGRSTLRRLLAEWDAQHAPKDSRE